jgi:protoheme IX farnesyltransferase
MALAGGRRLLDYLELTKPRLVLMVLVTTFVGFYMGSQDLPQYLRLLSTVIGTAFAAGGTLALNQSLERDIDAKMDRTKHRPIPDGRVQPAECFLLGAVAVTLGLLILALAVNVLSALLTAIVMVTYLFLYTPLKQKTSLCSLVGAVPGALPPVIGWSAARNDLGLEAGILFAVLYLWQIPHNLAIARLYRDDFARAGIRFLPVIDSDGQSTGRHVVFHCLALLLVSLMPTLIGFAGMLYYGAAILLGLLFLLYGWRLALTPSTARARQLLFASLFYLPVLFFVMALDRVPV